MIIRIKNIKQKEGYNKFLPAAKRRKSMNKMPSVFLSMTKINRVCGVVV